MPDVYVYVVVLKSQFHINTFSALFLANYIVRNIYDYDTALLLW